MDNEINHDFKNKCIECGSNNIEMRGKTGNGTLVYLCYDCLKVWDVKDNKWQYSTRAQRINGNIVLAG